MPASATAINKYTAQRMTGRLEFITKIILKNQRRQRRHVSKDGHCTCCTQSGRAAVPKLLRCITKHSSTSRHTRHDASHAVFNHSATLGINPQRSSGSHLHIRKGLGARQLVTTEDIAFEVAHQAALVQL